MNELSTNQTAKVAELLIPENQLATDLGIWPREDTNAFDEHKTVKGVEMWPSENANIFMRWLSLLTDIGYQGWKQRGSSDYGI